MKSRNIYSEENKKYICYAWNLFCGETGYQWHQIILSNKNLQPVYCKTLFNASDEFVKEDAEILLTTYDKDPVQPQA